MASPHAATVVPYRAVDTSNMYARSHAEYMGARQAWVDITNELKRKHKEYDEWLQTVEAQFKRYIADLEEQEARAKDKVEASRRAAKREMERDVSQIMGDADVPVHERKLRAEQRMAAYERDYNPNDEYEEQRHMHPLDSLLGALSGVMMTPPVTFVSHVRAPPMQFRHAAGPPQQRFDGQSASGAAPRRESVLIEEVD